MFILNVVFFYLQMVLSKLILKEVYLIGLNNKHLYKIFTNTKYHRYLLSSQDQGLILSKWKLVEVWFN